VRLHGLRRAFALGAAGLAAAGATQAAGQGPPPAQTRDPNPCLTDQASELNCPDLVMRAPWGVFAERARGRTLLRAGNSIDSVGRGPAELHGVRTSRRFMRARQRIYTRDGGRIGVRTGARLEFKYAHLRRRWWKFHNAAHFELWRLAADGTRIRRVRVGPKVSYCLRDLRRTRPWILESPGRRFYPACNTNPRQRRVTLGTSVGWSDIYPPKYPEQWIDVTGLRGCFAYVHRADPKNHVWESNEGNNDSQRIVRLPWRASRPSRGCL
jgi:hypothetical protein